MGKLTRAIAPVFLLAACLFALDPNSLKPQGYVSDFAHVLDAQSRAQLEEYCGRVEQATGVQKSNPIIRRACPFMPRKFTVDKSGSTRLASPPPAWSGCA
jgi:hypothetical protein